MRGYQETERWDEAVLTGMLQERLQNGKRSKALLIRATLLVEPYQVPPRGAYLLARKSLVLGVAPLGGSLGPEQKHA